MSIRLQVVDFGLEGWTPTTLTQTQQEQGIGSAEKPVLATPLKALTTGEIDGTGVFDRLMKATKLHLDEEFASHRITGNEYSNVFLGALTAVLQVSVQFLLNEQQVHRINAEIGLIRQQTVTELANTDDNIPVGLGFNHVPQETTPIPPIE